jgi:hypothetical protein
MVTHRTPGSFRQIQTLKAREYFEKFARKDFVRNRRTQTFNASGRVAGYSTASITIMGDLQFISGPDSEFVQAGLAEVGDAMFFTLPDYDVLLEDEIVCDNVTYRLSKTIESEQTQGETVYKGFLAKRLPSDDA